MEWKYHLNIKSKIHGLDFIGEKSSSTIRNTIIRGGHIGVRVYDHRAPLLESLTVVKNEAGGVGCWDKSSPEIVNANISENKYGDGYDKPLPSD